MRTRVGVVAAALTASLMVPLPLGQATERPQAPEPTDVPGLHVKDALVEAPKPVWTVDSQAVRGPHSVAWPTPGSAVIEADGRLRTAGDLPVRVSSAQAAGAGRLAVTMHDRNAAKAAGVDGPLLSVTPADPRTGSIPATIEVDYSGFAQAYGGDWATRLRIVRLPACALDTPTQPACQTATPLPTTNNPTDSTVTADVTVTAASSTLLAVTGGATGDNGDYTATSLSSAATWHVSTQTGDFSWSYPLRTPPSPGGPAPSLGLSYSSGSVDGHTSTSNNQGGWIGDGWDGWPGFIERKYASCNDDNPGHKTGDLCWKTDNATLSLGGHAGELIQSGNVWRLRSDDGTKIERLTDAARANGDDNNEYWKVTTTDGVQYFFGYHRLPGFTSGKPTTNSTWTVPVFGNNTGEPCNTGSFATSYCAQAWRWNLDYVVDRHGNTLAYFYQQETGAYGRDLTPSQRTTYDRGGWLDRIEYGMRYGQEYAQAAPLRVVFETKERCPSGCWTGAAWTSDAVPNAWPDTPWDQYCKESPCTDVLSPTFWSARRLTKITTQVRNGASSYADADSWTLAQEFLNAGNNEGTPMWLRGITHTGHVTSAGGSAVSDPQIIFGPGSEPLANRVDGPSDGRTSLNRWRIKQIRSESGGDILVTYSGHDCSATSLPTPETNTKRCMPAFYAPSGTGDPTLDWFHKYVVDRIDLDDVVTDQPTHTIFYDYLDTPAWQFTEDELTPDKYRTWSDWRGYGRVRVRDGDPSQGTQTAVEYRYLRGKQGATVTDSWGGTITDHQALAGFLLQEITYNGFDGSVGAEVSSTRNEPWLSGPTAARTRNGITVQAWKTNTAATRERTALESGGFRYSKTATGFNADGLPTTAENLGDEGATGDETCTRTTYARNDTIWMIDKVAQVETLSVSCAAATTPAAPATVLNRSRHFYDTYVDESSFGAAPSKGNLVRTEELDHFTGSTPIYVRTATNGYDANGRLTSTTDARGHTTTTTYTTVHGGLVASTVTRNPLGHEVTEQREPAWDVPVKTIDPNGIATELTYDGLGRLTAVWLPDRPRASFPTMPSLKFGYLVRNTDGPSVVTTEALIPTGAAYRKTVQLFDGFLRERQTQSQAPQGGRTLTDTLYNTRGETAWTSAAYYDSTNAPPSTTVGDPDGQIPAITRYVYDGAGRPTASIFEANGAEVWRTTTAYGGDRVHVTPPEGDTATTAIADARGRRIELRQYRSFTDVGTADPSRFVRTRYAYTLLDQPKTIVDQLGNTWSYSYDLRGRQTQATDPDRGTTTTTYDAAGNLLTTTSPLGSGTATVAFTHDELGRKTSVRDDSPTGTIRAKWVYDTLANGKGKLSSATRYVAGDAYTTRVDAYDPFGRPKSTSLALPAAESALCAAGGTDPCTYTTSVVYRPTSVLGRQTLPATADLPAETLTYGYSDDLGLPVGLYAAGTIYVDGTDYNKLGQVIGRVLGDSSLNKHVDFTYTYDEPTRRLTEMNVVPALKPEAVNYGYEYDDAGNVTKISDAPSGQVADHQCFGYDYLRRLTEAWTPSAGTCTAAPSYAGLGGPAPYWHQWTIDAIGNRITEKRKAAGGDTTYTYTYPTSGAESVRPHAVTSITATGAQSWTRGYAYDAGGNTRTRTSASGATQTLGFDREGRVETVVDPTGTTRYLYHADGRRLIRTDPNGSKTLYLPDGTEVRYDKPSNTKKATRYYGHNGTTIAVRTSTSLSWIATDHQGTADVVIDAVTANVAKRHLLPFGQQRGVTSGSWPAAMDKGFVGGTNDPTGLTHLGAREYDPFIGRFISIDPLVDPADPQSLHGYAYANNTPVTLSDPTGLAPVCDWEGGNISAGCKPPEDSYQEARDTYFGKDTPPGSTRTTIRTNARAPGKGIVVARTFIEHDYAAFYLLRGDGRGFSMDPKASYRIVIAWDTETGEVSFIVTASCTVFGECDSPGPAGKEHPVPLFPQDPITDAGANSIKIIAAGADQLEVHFSGLNSVLPCCSVDATVGVRFDTEGTFVSYDGDNYPSFEAIQYREGHRPRSIASFSNSSVLAGLNVVPPAQDRHQAWRNGLTIRTPIPPVMPGPPSVVPSWPLGTPSPVPGPAPS